jgi:predicted  nucleic acid-binding Zn-ribbon protein
MESRISVEIGELRKEKITLQKTITELKDNVLTKEGEVAALQDCLKKMENASDEEVDDILQALLHEGRSKAELKLMTIERDTLAEKLQGEIDARKLLEGKVHIYFCNIDWYHHYDKV